MHLKVVGAGLGRTGTLSLKIALERLLGGPCYHMIEVFGKPDHIAFWQAAAEGDDVEWDAVLGGHVAAVDWPACAFWRPLAAANADAPILLSTRTDAEAWFTSASSTIFKPPPGGQPAPGTDPFTDMWMAVVIGSFAEDFRDHDAATAAYDAHNAAVLAEADPARLVTYQPGDGWAPLCAMLGVDVPDEPFPHLNTSEEWASRALDSAD